MFIQTKEKVKLIPVVIDDKSHHCSLIWQWIYSYEEKIMPIKQLFTTNHVSPRQKQNAK
jgi:hypothetical protein